VVREQIIKPALDEPTLSPRELAVRFTDTENYFVSEASVYRLLKAHDLIASPAFIVMINGVAISVELSVQIDDGFGIRKAMHLRVCSP
jgi:hypothetical protein